MGLYKKHNKTTTKKKSKFVSMQTYSLCLMNRMYNFAFSASLFVLKRNTFREVEMNRILKKEEVLKNNICSINHSSLGLVMKLWSLICLWSFSFCPAHWGSCVSDVARPRFKIHPLPLALKGKCPPLELVLRAFLPNLKWDCISFLEQLHLLAALRSSGASNRRREGGEGGQSVTAGAL